MSLKTPETRLEELGLSAFCIVYDDEENESLSIAWLSRDGVDLGYWDSNLKYTAIKELRNFRELYHLTAIVEECRAGFQSSDYDNTLRQMRAHYLWTECKGWKHADLVAIAQMDT